MNKGVLIIGIVLVAGIISLFMFAGNSNSNTDLNQETQQETNQETSQEQETTSQDTQEQTQPENPEPLIIEINIQNFNYSPKEITISQGDTIIWTNLDSPAHTVTSDSGSELSSGLLSKDETYSHTFNEVGIFDYHCAPHPYMKGTVIVE